MLVKVAIDLSLGKLFTYEVPENLKEKLAIGQLLSVPFGHREARGFAIELAQALPEHHNQDSFKLKPISAIVDEVPFFSATLLKVAKMISAYLGAPIESVLKAALPAAVLKKNVKPRELIFIEPKFSLLPVKLTERQQWLYDQIVRLGGGWMAQLIKELKTTNASLRELGAKGLINISVKERRRDPLSGKRFLPSKPLPLNDEQRAALNAIYGVQPSTSNLKPVLLYGVTGSGKTEVYLQAIAKELEAGKGAIVMVPEISLTPQTVQRFASRFGSKVAVLHSALSDGERYDEWHRIRAGEARVVIGPRSAVWAPVKNLGLIVVDEEHETSYKQDETPRYHARDVAVLRGHVEGARVVLGSATPSLESWHNVEIGKYVLAEMKQRAGKGTLPNIHLVDMKFERGGIFSRELLDAIKARLDRHEQTILFLNRRGYARSVSCPRCGYVFECEDCGVPFTYHQSDNCLRCHICGGWQETPSECPECKEKILDMKGIGTQRAEAALKKCFKEARVLRMDADSTSRKYSHDDILGAFRRHEADILIGTQMIAKGLDFPNVTLVGVLNADSSLNLPDFRAAERTYQLLSQVAGRAGRAELPGEVFVQSLDPSVNVLRSVLKGDFSAFAKEELADRKAASFPPFTHLALINMRSQDLNKLAAWAQMYAESLRNSSKELMVSDAISSPLEKAEGYYRYQIVVRSENPRLVTAAWKAISEKREPPKSILVSLDLDAYNMI
ncbi:MAG: primosomal protein N' [Kiritimatiellae bacterium]|nr:primosomal protein N' [Kiritimatiellia bacterium]